MFTILHNSPHCRSINIITYKQTRINTPNDFMLFEKNLFKTSAISLSLERLWLFLICDTFIGKHWFKSFPKFPISVMSFLLRLLKQFWFVYTWKFLCLVYFFTIFLAIFLRKLFLNFVLFITSLCNVFFTNGDWFPLIYFFFHGACLCTIPLLYTISLSFVLIPVTESWFTRYFLKSLFIKLLLFL